MDVCRNCDIEWHRASMLSSPGSNMQITQVWFGHTHSTENQWSTYTYEMNNICIIKGGKESVNTVSCGFIGVTCGSISLPGAVTSCHHCEGAKKSLHQKLQCLIFTFGSQYR